MIGNIPQNLTLFIREPFSLRNNYEDSELQIGETIQVRPTFVSDVKNKKTLETGQKWAGGYDWSWNKKIKFDVEEGVMNAPITDVKIVGLEIRSEGGRAYKVVVNGKYYVDFREDVLLDTLLGPGVEPGGKLKGEFVWCKVNSEMKLVRVGSALHSALLKANEFDASKVVKDLEVGGIYLNKKGERFVYMGKMDVAKLIDVSDPKTSQGYGDKLKNYQNIQIEKFTNQLIFCKWSTYYKEFNEAVITGFYIQSQKTHCFKQKIGTVEIPENWLSTMKDSLIKKDKERYYGNEKLNYKAMTPESVMYYSKWLNIGGIHPLCQELLDKKASGATNVWGYLGNLL